MPNRTTVTPPKVAPPVPTTNTAATPKAKPSKQMGISSLSRFKRPIPAKSITAAKNVFAKFSLSKFAGNRTPSNYVLVGQSPTVTQRRIISQYTTGLNNGDASTRAMTIALPEATIKQLLPSYDAKAGTIDLGEVMRLIQQNMRGTEFYAKGNPTLNRLAIQSQVQQIIDTVKQGAKNESK